jgi:DNA polymerase-3 subunit delta
LATAIRNARVWGRRQGALERAARRVDPGALLSMLRALATVDAVSKGIGHGDAWEELATIALAFAGKPAFPLPSPVAAR